MGLEGKFLFEAPFPCCGTKEPASPTPPGRAGRFLSSSELNREGTLETGGQTGKKSQQRLVVIYCYTHTHTHTVNINHCTIQALPSHHVWAQTYTHPSW